MKDKRVSRTQSVNKRRHTTNQRKKPSLEIIQGLVLKKTSVCAYADFAVAARVRSCSDKILAKPAKALFSIFR